MIQVEHLTRRYGDLRAVDDVSFHVGRGQVVGLLGHNGAGKTTVMKMLTGYLEPTSGTVRVDELLLGRDDARIRRRIGYLPENCPVWPEMTVIDYLEYRAALQGVPATRRRAAVARAIARTALKEKAGAVIQTLSRGYRQRVGVAQAILHEPDIVILDEPTNGLDPTQIRQMRALIGELAATATVILSTHILQEVQACCQRVLIMRAGRLVVDSTLAELQTSAALRVCIDREARQLLAGVDGAQGVEALEPGEGRWRYRIHGAPDLAPRVAALLQRSGIGLYELHPERQDLETVFASVNEARTGEAAHA